jgi:hypothetical protein
LYRHALLSQVIVSSVKTGEASRGSLARRHIRATLFRPYATENQPREHRMPDEAADLDAMQTAYKAAVEQWIAAIRQEEALASVNHSIAEVDKWEDAHFREDDMRTKVKAAKRDYEGALRKKFFGF